MLVPAAKATVPFGRDREIYGASNVPTSGSVMASLLEKDGKRLAANAKVVRPALCPPSICI
jgi:hypothetical protein